MGKPRIFSGPASRYEGPREIIREFSARPNYGEANGLIAIREAGEDDNRKLVIEIYSVTGDVIVNVDPERLHPAVIEKIRSTA